MAFFHDLIPLPRLERSTAVDESGELWSAREAWPASVAESSAGLCDTSASELPPLDPEIAILHHLLAIKARSKPGTLWWIRHNRGTDE